MITILIAFILVIHPSHPIIPAIIPVIIPVSNSYLPKTECSGNALRDRQPPRSKVPSPEPDQYIILAIHPGYDIAVTSVSEMNNTAAIQIGGDIARTQRCSH